MAEVKFKFVGDDSELRKKLANLSKIQSEMTDKFSKDLNEALSNSKSQVFKDITKDAANAAVQADRLNKIAANKALVNAKLEQIDSIRRLREERSKEISELNNLKKVEQEHKANLALQKSEIQSLVQQEKELNLEYKRGLISSQEYTRSTKEQAEERRKANQVEREAEKALKASEKARKDAEREAAKHAKETAKRKKQLEQESSEYYKLNKALGAVRKETKEILAEMFRMERQGHANTLGYEALKKKSEDLTKQTLYLDRGIKKIDSTLGLHQRNVGNYGSAIELLGPQFESINQKLALFGTSIDDLATKPNAFKELGLAVAGFGKQLLAFVMTPVGAAIAALAALFALFQSNKQTVIDFNSGLRNVSKTTGIVGDDLDDFGDAIIDLSMKLKVIDSTKLLEYASIAGQLGIKGRADILAFTEALAMLETASDITGEEGGREIARMLTLVDGGVQNVKAFGDEIVNLGNNFAATEKEILANAEQIAQNVGIYKIGRQDVLAFATATKAVGLEAELVGSTFSRTLGEFEKSIRSGKGVADLLKIIGGTSQDLSKRFKDDAAGVFIDYIKGLNGINKAGGSVNEALERTGIIAVRDQRVIASLASNGYDVLTGALDKVKTANGAMQAEFENGAGKLEQQSKRMGIAWDNFVLSIENGEGAIGRSVVAIMGFFADLLDQINKTFNPTSVDEFLARLTNFDKADKIREINLAFDSGNKSFNSIANTSPTNSNVNSLLKETESTLKTVTEAYNKYKDAVNKGVLTDGGKAKFQDFDVLLKSLRMKQGQLTLLGGSSSSFGIPKISFEETETEIKKREAAEKTAEKARQLIERKAEAARQSVVRQRKLQGDIEALANQSTRNQLSRDDEEIASIKDKYAKMRDEVRKFYADPKNKGLRVDEGKLKQAESFEVSEATTRQGTKELLKRLNEQKSVYDQYNAYVEQNGVAAAERMFSDQADLIKDYRSKLESEYFAISTLQKTAALASFTGIGVKLTQAQEERAKELKQMLDALDKEDAVKARAKYAEALQLAQDFNAERLKIEKKYQDARASLGKAITPEEDKELTRKENKEKSQLAVTQLQESDAWASLFSDLDNKTVKQIETLIAEIEKQFDDLSVNFDPIDLAATRKKLQEAKDIIIDTNPFKAVGVALKGIFKGASDNSTESAEEIRQHWTNLSKATNKSFAFIENAINSAEFLGDALGETGKTAMSVLSGVAMTATAVATAIKSAEKASVVLAVIQAALAVMQAVFSFIDGAAKRRNEELKKEQEYYNVLSDTFDVLIEKQKQLFEEKSGKGALKAYQDALDLIGSKQVANRKSLEAWFAQGASWKSHSNWYNYDKELGNVLSRQKLLNMSGSEWENLLKNQTSLWAKLPEEVRAYAESVISAKGETEDLKKAIQEALTGVSLDDLRGEFESLASMADLTFEDISNSFYKHMQKAVLRMIQDEKFSADMQKWYDNLLAATEDENLTQDEADLLKQQYQSIAEAQNARYKAIMDVIGNDPAESTSDKSIKGKLSRELTEKTGGEIVGISRASYDIHKKQLALLQSMSSNNVNLLAIANEKLAVLNSINTNTANTVFELKNAVVELKAINKNTSKTGRSAEGMGL